MDNKYPREHLVGVNPKLRLTIKSKLTIHGKSRFRRGRYSTVVKIAEDVEGRCKAGRGLNTAGRNG